MKQKLFFIIIFVVGISVGGFYFADFIRQHPHFSARLDKHFWLLIGLSIILQMIGNLLRAYKTHFLLDRVRESRTSTLFKGLSIGYLFNALLPLRLGEFIRAYYLGDALAISKTTVFMSIIIERVADGVVLGITFLSAAWVIQEQSHSAAVIMTKFGVTVLIVSSLLMLLTAVIRSENQRLLRAIHSVSGLLNDKLSSRLRFMGWSSIYGTKLMLSGGQHLRKYAVATVVMWEFYFASTACVALAFFTNLTGVRTWLIVQSSYAGVSAPAGPGYAGSFHVIVSRVLENIGLRGVSSFSLLLWLVIISPISIIGLYVLVRQRFGEKHEANDQEALINKLYRDKDISPEMAHFLDAYLKGDRLNQILTQAELDGKWRLIKAFKGGSNASTMLAWQDEEFRVKKITLPQYAGKLADQAMWLKEREHLDHLPKVVNEEENQHYYYFDLAYRDEYYPFFDYIHSHAAKDCIRIVENVLTFMTEDIYQLQPAVASPDKVRGYIVGKILGKVNDTAAISSDISQLLTYPALVINGTSYQNILPVVEQIQANPKIMRELAKYVESPIHGDLTIDNLIVTNQGDFMVIDPNNENEVSSPVVDYGKLFQSLHSGYEFLIQLTDCQISGNEISFSEAKSQKYDELFRSLDRRLKAELDPAAYRSILFHEAVHYCRMLTYRAGLNPQTVAVFYATAVKLFNDFLAQYP